MYLDEPEQFHKGIIDELPDDGDGQHEDEVELDEHDELEIPHIMDNGGGHEMEVIDCHLTYLERICIMLEVVEDECIMGITLQNEVNEAAETDEMLLSLQS